MAYSLRIFDPTLCYELLIPNWNASVPAKGDLIEVVGDENKKYWGLVTSRAFSLDLSRSEGNGHTEITVYVDYKV